MSMEAFNQYTGELAQQGPTPPTPPRIDHPSDGTVSLIAWAQELDAAEKLGQWACQTTFAPAHFRGKPGDTTAALMLGKTLGMHPLAALTNIFVVHGTPGLYARAMVGIVQNAGHSIERVAATEQSVTVRGRRRGSQTSHDFTWTIQRAQQAGYTNNAKYRTDPIGMLTAKAFAEACRVIAPDALMGMPAATVEEIQMGDVIEVTEVDTPAPAPAAPKRTVKRKAAPKAPAPEAPEFVDEAPAVAVDDEPQQDEDPQPEQDAPSTRSQWIRLSNALEAIGVTEKTAKADEMRDWAKGQGLDRDINSAADLTSNETEAFISELAEIAAATQQTEEGQP